MFKARPSEKNWWLPRRLRVPDSELVRPTMRMTLEQRLDYWSVPEPNTGCILWLGALDQDGYSITKNKGKTMHAYKANYILKRGIVPSGVVLDHLCRVRSCINPHHLELVTNSENHRRGFWATKTHCKNGHPLSGNNLYVCNRPTKNGSGKQRMCRICREIASKKSSLKKRQLKGGYFAFTAPV